ncbi:hypothetical protein TTHERM_00486190 (macronuclear) [Tetrahymena thermophila SB210]|uniref:Uncharacterized protein n=1 Tax=Tetrahymena thermophila (strain SB210) TaxID=312017 RepID=I7M6G6_TETTS|nr:hypothetical protein TTHERM_00486190 [Tetrahymena thermophila SB210]EAR85168.2 hypothetical protein TTHERM_00486190 [Tetrahymena thermophila SB210]|eukprot:XP_001032831.2 hypothetical protein TTHERM_00486190 [Tetrahymena thermophila SB210]
MANQKSQNLLKKQNCQDDNKQEQSLKENNLSRENLTQMQNSTNNNTQALNDEISQLEKDILNSNTNKINNSITSRKNEPFFIDGKYFLQQDIPTSPQLVAQNLFLQKTLQQFQKCNNGFKVQPLQLTNVDAKQVIPKQPKKIQLDNRNKSIAYLQNIFHKNYLKQQSLIEQSNQESLNTSTKRQKILNNNIGNYSNIVNSKNEAILSSNHSNNFKENYTLQPECTESQHQNNYSELLLQFLKEENEHVNQAIRYNSMQQDSSNNNNKIQFLNKKNMNEEYFSCNYPPEIQHLKCQESAVLSERQTNQRNYNKESSILIKNLKNQIKHSSYFLQEMIQQKYDNQITQQNQQKYDSTKFENELRQKHKLQTIQDIHQKKSISFLLQQTLLKQSQANQKKQKNINLEEYNNLLDKIQQIQKYKQVSTTKSSKTLTEFPFKIQQSLDCLELNRLSSWEEDQKLDNFSLKRVLTFKKDICQKQLSFTENLLNQKIHKQQKVSAINEHQVQLRPLNRKLNINNSVSQSQKQYADSLFIDQANAFEVVIDNNKQSVRNLNQNIKLSSIQNRTKPQKKQSYNQNYYEHIQLETQDKNHKLCKKQSSSNNLYSSKQTNNYFSSQENKNYNNSKIFYEESYDIENYIHDQRHIK